MRKALITGVCVGMTALAANVGAEGMPSAKATAQVSGIAPLVASSSGSEWRTVLSNSLKTSAQKDLFVSVSLECGLTTDTQVESRAKTRDTSIAKAQVQVMVIMDPGTPSERLAEPGVVNYCSRVQELSAVFAGIFEGPAECTTIDPLTGETLIDGDCLDASCLRIDPLTGAIVIDELCLAPEEVGLILDTMTASSFDFVLDDLGSGAHTIAVMARIATDSSAMQGSAEARAFIGKGAVTVEEVRLIKGDDFVQ